MNSVEARQILGIKDDLITPERVKEAYRRAAFHAHPDRGGTVQEFLKIQAAYEFLMGNQGDSAWGETSLELEKRLNEIGRAFDRIKTDFGPVFGDQFDGMADRMAVTMQGLDSTGKIERNWAGSVQNLWMEFQLSVYQHISTRVEGISRAFDAWLAKEMKTTIRFAREQYLKTIPHNPIYQLSSFFISGTSIWGTHEYLAPQPFNWWLLPLLFPGACLLTWFCFFLYAGSKYNEGTLLPKMETQKVTLRNGDLRYHLGGIWTKEQSGGAGLVSGAGIGFMVGGPAGAVVGGILGGIAGAILGTPIGEVQGAVYQDTLNRLFPLAEKLYDDLLKAMENLKKDYLNQARENYKKASRKTVLLLTGK